MPTKKVLKKWDFESLYLHTVAFEYADNTTEVVFTDTLLNMKTTHFFPADFIRPVFDDPELFHVLVTRDFCHIYYNGDNCLTAINLINVLYHREHPYNLGKYYDIEREALVWKEQEH